MADRRYRDEDWLTERFVDEDKGAYEIADIYDVDYTTIYRWLTKFELHEPERRGGHGVYYSHDDRGYPTILVREDGQCHCIRVHRLIMLIDHDTDEVANNHTHHKNEIKIDLRPENLQLKDPSQHIIDHRRSVTHEALLSLVSEIEPATTRKVASELSILTDTAYYQLDKLCDKGKLKKELTGRRNHYWIADDREEPASPEIVTDGGVDLDEDDPAQRPAACLCHGSALLPARPPCPECRIRGFKTINEADVENHDWDVTTGDTLRSRQLDTGICPQCGGIEIETIEHDFDDFSATQRLLCNECYTDWLVRYVLPTIEDVSTEGGHSDVVTDGGRDVTDGDLVANLLASRFDSIETIDDEFEHDDDMFAVRCTGVTGLSTSVTRTAADRGYRARWIVNETISFGRIDESELPESADAEQPARELFTDGGVDLKSPASTCTAEDPTRCDACGQPFETGQSVAIGEIATVRVPNGQPIFETEATLTRRHESCPDEHTEPDDPSPMYPEQDDARHALLNGDPGPYRFELTFEYTNPCPEDAGRRMNRPEGKTGVAMEVAESSEQAREQLRETAAEHGREIDITFTSVYARTDR